MLADYQQVTQQYRNRVYSFAFYSLRAREDAEDITQEVLLRLWQHWQKIDHNKVSAWLMRVAHNSVIDHVRRQKSRKDTTDHDVDIENTLASREEEVDLTLQPLLQSAIRELDDPYRSIVVMREIQGLSYREIGEVLELSDSQVKVYLHRSRRKLRENPDLREAMLLRLNADNDGRSG